MNIQNKVLWSHTFFGSDGTPKQLQICFGDLCDINESYDVLVCSSFKNGYHPSKKTLIGNLYRKKNISVSHLAKHPEINLKNQGCWVSHRIEGNYKRIACVELLDFTLRAQTDLADSIVLKSTFSTLRLLLEEMAAQQKEVTSVALPILGTGSQGIETCYVIPPLLNQCMEALKNIPELKKISFYEIDYAKATELKELCESVFLPLANSHQVFISYSSKQQEIAYKLKHLLSKNDISCWMAPESIPAGSSYQKEIPAALSNISTVLLILSPEAEASRWVQKEIGCTIGAKHALIPYKLKEYLHSSQFNFLLDGEQIFEVYKYSPEESDRKLIQLLKEKLQLPSSNIILNNSSEKKLPYGMEKDPEELSDYELLHYLTHCAFDPDYINQKPILSSIKQMIKNSMAQDNSKR